MRRDLIHNEDIHEELDIHNVNDKIEESEENWKQYLNSERIPIVVYKSIHEVEGMVELPGKSLNWTKKNRTGILPNP